MTASGNKLIDAATTLVGWINYSATDPFERTRVSAEIVRLSVPLDTTDSFSLLFSHPGAAAAVTAVLQVAPLLKDGTTGTWVTAATGSRTPKSSAWRRTPMGTMCSGSGKRAAPPRSTAAPLAMSR